LSFFGGVVATACVLGVALIAVQSSGGVKNSALSMYVPFNGFESYGVPDQESWCMSHDFRNVAMKTAVDATIFGLVKDINLDQKFEGSGVVKVNHAFYVICDSSWSIPVFHDLSASGRLDDIYDPKAKKHERWQHENSNYLIPPADLSAFPHNVDSNWEAITVNEKTGQHITVQESLPLKDGKYHAIIMNVNIQHHPPQWTLDYACPSEFTFLDESKGFEGLLGMNGIDGRFFLLGLCEGNHCNTGDIGKEHGHGMMVIMELDQGEGPPNTFKDGYLQETSTCRWKTLRTVNLPSVAFFEDYSDVARRGDVIVISSQASSSLLFANMVLEDGLLNPETFEVTGGQVTKFAPTSDCQTQYCNVEGIDFINDRMLIGASDSMKGGGPPHGQPFMCLEKDQSMHVFALPNKVELEF